MPATMLNIFQTILRDHYNGLPEVVRRFHESRIASYDGTVNVTGAPGWMASRLRSLFSLPQPGENMKINVKVLRTEREERWLRQWGGVQFSSTLNRVRKGNMLSENLGMVKLFFDLGANDQFLRWRMIEWNFAGIPLPLFLGPDIEAFESADENGNYRFTVKVMYPGVGELVSYDGSLGVGERATNPNG
jgi:hypothetical protein